MQTLVTVQKMCFLHDMGNNAICLRFLWRKHGKSNSQHGKYVDCMETDTFCEDFMVKLVPEIKLEIV